MVPWKSFTFAMSRIQCKKKEIFRFKVTVNFVADILYVYFHQIEDVEFICDSHGQTFLPTLYVQVIMAHLDLVEFNAKMLANLETIEPNLHCCVKDDATGA